MSLSELKALAAQILDAGHSFHFRARGASMQPFIRNGDVIEVRPVAAGDIRRGSGVLCRDSEGRLLAHRVIRVGKSSLLTRGDALMQPDGLIPYDQLLGRVATIYRGRKCIGVSTCPQHIIALTHTALSTVQICFTRFRWALAPTQPARARHAPIDDLPVTG